MIPALPTGRISRCWCADCSEILVLLQRRGSVLPCGAHQSVGEEDADAVGVAQGEDVDDLLGRAVAGEAADVRGDEVHKAVGHRDEARIRVHNALVQQLQSMQNPSAAIQAFRLIQPLLPLSRCSH